MWHNGGDWTHRSLEDVAYMLADLYEACYERQKLLGHGSPDDPWCPAYGVSTQAESGFPFRHALLPDGTYKVRPSAADFLTPPMDLYTAWQNVVRLRYGIRLLTEIGFLGSSQIQHFYEWESAEAIPDAAYTVQAQYSARYCHADGTHMSVSSLLALGTYGDAWVAETNPYNLQRVQNPDVWMQLKEAYANLTHICWFPGIGPAYGPDGPGPAWGRRRVRQATLWADAVADAGYIQEVTPGQMTVGWVGQYGMPSLVLPGGEQHTILDQMDVDLNTVFVTGTIMAARVRYATFPRYNLRVDTDVKFGPYTHTFEDVPSGTEFAGQWLDPMDWLPAPTPGSFTKLTGDILTAPPAIPPGNMQPNGTYRYQARLYLSVWPGDVLQVGHPTTGDANAEFCHVVTDVSGLLNYT